MNALATPEIDAAIDLVISAYAHCACAAGQALPSDDQIIIDHVRQAENELREAMATLRRIKQGSLSC